MDVPINKRTTMGKAVASFYSGLLTKSSTEAINLHVTDATFDILKRRLKEAKGPYLFPHRQDPNKPLTTVRKAHLDALKEAKIRPRFRLYDLRHTFG